jgi:hypothetical protein
MATQQRNDTHTSRSSVWLHAFLAAFLLTMIQISGPVKNNSFRIEADEYDRVS